MTMTTPSFDGRPQHAGRHEISLHWLEPGEYPRDVVAQRNEIYGSELGWIDGSDGVAWDEFDGHSMTLVAYRSGELVASSRLTLESDGALEVSELCDWKSALPARDRGLRAAEWSRVMIARSERGHGLFRAMYASMSFRARCFGARLIAGASVAALRPRYERLGFRYLDRPFRSPFFACSPVYYPAYQRIP